MKIIVRQQWKFIEFLVHVSFPLLTARFYLALIRVVWKGVELELFYCFLSSILPVIRSGLVILVVSLGLLKRHNAGVVVQEDGNLSLCEQDIGHQWRRFKRMSSWRPRLPKAECKEDAQAILRCCLYKKKLYLLFFCLFFLDKWGDKVWSPVV